MPDLSTRFDQIESPETIEFGDEGQATDTGFNPDETQFSDLLNGDLLISTDDNLDLEINGVTPNFDDVTSFPLPDLETLAADGLDGGSEAISDLFDPEIGDPLFGDSDSDGLDGDGLDGDGLDSGFSAGLVAGGGGDDVLIGNDGDNTLQGGPGNDVLDGGEGNDTADFSDIPFEVTADLTAGTAQYVAASGATVIDSLINIENLTGSANNDFLTGDDGGNLLGGDIGDDALLGGGGGDILEGGFGDDFLQGGGGNDTLNGGDGFDTVSFADIGAEVAVNLNDDGSGLGEYIVDGATVVDTFTNIEAIVGSENNDNITFAPGAAGTAAAGGGDDTIIASGAAANIIDGGAGDDSLQGGGGDDVLDGGEGNDTVRFDDIDVGVTADLTAGSAERNSGFDLTIADVTLVNPNDGLAADQIVSEGIAGNLYFNFHTNDFPSGELRGQLDLVADNRDAAGVGTVEFTASLSGDQAVPAPTDTDASGTATTLLTVASDGSVTYSTEVSLAGLNQADLLSVDIGNGTLSPIHLHNASEGVNGPVVVDVATDAGPEGIVAISETDSLSSIENVAGSNDADIIIGDANNNVLEGLDGDDTLEGGGGDDILEGGFGDDFLQGGGGNDTLNGGDGFDTLSFADIGVEVAVTLNEDGSGFAEYVVNGATVVDTFTNIEAIIGSENNDSITLAPTDQLLAQLDTALIDTAITAQDTEFDPVQLSPDDVITSGFAAFDDIDITFADPDRESLLGTSAFPAALSGNSAFTGGFADILSSLYGEDDLFTAVSQDLPGGADSFDSFLDAINEDAIGRLGSIGGEASLTDAIPTDFNIGTLVADIITQPSFLESQGNSVA